MSGLRLLVVAVFALILSPATAGAVTPSASFGIGSEATLPANAATVNQSVSINSVSCSSAGNCGAVGTYLDGSGNTQGLLLTESGGTWSTGAEAALPANAATTNQSVLLKSVSCPSAGTCTAVGSYVDNSSDGQGLVLTQTGGTWGVGLEVTPPANAAADPGVGLNSVSCPSAGNCSAVGGYFASTNNNIDALVLSETAGSWGSAAEAVLPADAATFNGDAYLQSVSCPSAGNCSAVGGYLSMPTADSWAGQGLLVSETGGTWATGIEASLPANARTPNPQAGLNSISCSSVGNCTAVGGYADASVGAAGLLLTETAGSWATGVRAILPANADNALNAFYTLESVSCGSAGNCTAVGAYLDSAANLQGLLVNETAGTWTNGVEASLPPDAATANQSAILTSVSCPSAGDCSAVGTYNTSPSAGGAGVLLTETAGSWATGTEVFLPSNGEAAGGLDSISCTSAQACSGVGSYAVAPPGGLVGLLVATSSTPPKQTLGVSKTGTGSGTVTSSPSGISCGSSCASSFDEGTEVTLTATASQGSAFDGWSGGGCSGFGTCKVQVDHATAVTATFDRLSYSLSVQKSGDGSGTVISTAPDNRLGCGPTCVVAFDAGTQVVLLATPDNGSVFEGWSGGGCSGTQSGCTLTVTAATTVAATFAQVQAQTQAQCVVPNVRKKALAGAKSRLLASHCRVGKVTRKASRKVRKGHVISQSPAPGRHLAKGAKINLVVSKG